MPKKGWKELNETEKRLMINGLKVDIALKCNKMIGDSEALRILKLPTMKSQKLAIKKIKDKC